MVELPPEAARAVEAIRRTRQNVRFEVKKACEQQRWRLKILFDTPDPDTGEVVTTHLGLIWSEDRVGVLALRDALARGDATPTGGEAR